MEYIVNNNTGKEYEVVYFKFNNDQVLAEHTSAMVASGDYSIIEKDEQ